MTLPVITSEVIYYSDFFDAPFTLVLEITAMHSEKKIPVILFTDSKSLFYIISRGYKNY